MDTYINVSNMYLKYIVSINYFDLNWKIINLENFCSAVGQNWIFVASIRSIPEFSNLSDFIVQRFLIEICVNHPTRLFLQIFVEKYKIVLSVHVPKMW